MTALGVIVDGAPIPDSEARAFWRRFSQWMEEHPGDLGGFARTEGLASVHPEMRAGAPVLVASRNAPQRAYAPAAAPRPAVPAIKAAPLPSRTGKARATRAGPKRKDPR